MRIVRGVLIALSLLFLLATLGLPFGVNFAFHGWYLDGGAAKVAAAERALEQRVNEVKKATGGKMPPALQKELDKEMTEERALLAVTRSMANWELVGMIVALGLAISLFLPRRLVPRLVAGLLILVSVLAIARVPDLSIAVGETSGFEIKTYGGCSIVAALFAILASLIGVKSPLSAVAPESPDASLVATRD